MGWYRLHRLIADILRARPTARRERQDLQRRAAQWYRHNGMPLDAIELERAIASLRGTVAGLTDQDSLSTNLGKITASVSAVEQAAKLKPSV